MVQVIPIYETEVPAIRRNMSFWKLIRLEGLTCSRIKDSLRGAGYRFNASANKEQLIQQHLRCQRGLLSYAQCTTAELRTFCVARGLASTQEVKHMRSPNLVHRLSEADNGETFNHFLDLPAELRVQIYELYFEGFHASGSTPRAPYPIPLAKSCTVVRREVMPVYLGTFTYELNLWSCPPWSRERGFGPLLIDFVKNSAAWQIALLRKLKVDAIIQGHWDLNRDDRIDSTMWCNIDLGTDHKLATLQIDHEHSEEEAEGEFDLITPLLQDVVETISTRAGGRRLLKTDVEDIIDIFQYPPQVLTRCPTPGYSEGEGGDYDGDESSTF